MKALTDRTLVFAEFADAEVLTSAKEQGADGVLLTVRSEGGIPEVCFAGGEPAELDDIYRKLKDTGLAVQLKLLTREDAGFVKALDLCAQRSGISGRVIYTSEWHRDLCLVSERMPDAFTAPVCGENLVRPWIYAAYLGSRAVVASAADVLADPDYVDRAHNMNIRVHVSDIPDEETMRRLVGLGCDVLMTAQPAEARALVW